VSNKAGRVGRSVICNTIPSLLACWYGVAAVLVVVRASGGSSAPGRGSGRRPRAQLVVSSTYSSAWGSSYVLVMIMAAPGWCVAGRLLRRMY